MDQSDIRSKKLKRIFEYILNEALFNEALEKR